MSDDSPRRSKKVPAGVSMTSVGNHSASSLPAFPGIPLHTEHSPVHPSSDSSPSPSPSPSPGPSGASSLPPAPPPPSHPSHSSPHDESQPGHPSDEYLARELGTPAHVPAAALDGEVMGALLKNEAVRYECVVEANTRHELWQAAKHGKVSDGVKRRMSRASHKDAFKEGPTGWTAGRVVLTSYRLFFVPLEEPQLVVPSYTLPVACVGEIRKHKKRDVLDVVSKDGRLLQYDFAAVGKDKRRLLTQLLTASAFPPSGYHVFAFLAGRSSPLGPDSFLYQPEREYARVFGDSLAPLGEGSPSSWSGSETPRAFRYCMINETYSFSPTYPRLLVVPTAITDEELQRIGGFRSKSRIPALTWRHPSNGATISRSSQPMTGLSGVRNQADEVYLGRLKNASQKLLHIIDVRPKANALANKLRGGGFEATEGKERLTYPDAALEFAPVENIHVMRHALADLWKLAWTVAPSDPLWYPGIAASRWLEFTHSVILAGARLATLVEGGASALVHCSDGWDRTSQTIALAELLLDPYYRTIEGFMVLVEKDWLSYGHMFARRVGHGSAMADPKDSQRAPIFLQWIDAVWQVWTQSPQHFEFNELFLLTILEHLFSCRFGTFLGDCERERLESQIPQRTDSLWDYLLARRSHYLNQLYAPSTTTYLVINLNVHAVRYWSEFHLHRNMTLVAPLSDALPLEVPPPLPDESLLPSSSLLVASSSPPKNPPPLSTSSTSTSSTTTSSSKHRSKRPKHSKKSSASSSTSSAPSSPPPDPK